MSEERPAVTARNAALIGIAASSMGVPPDALELFMACDFCGEDTRKVEFLIAGTAVLEDVDVHICPGCVEACCALIADRRAAPPHTGTGGGDG